MLAVCVIYEHSFEVGESYECQSWDEAYELAAYLCQIRAGIDVSTITWDEFTDNTYWWRESEEIGKAVAVQIIEIEYPPNNLIPEGIKTNFKQ